ncbi:hypothetical protein ALQ41_200010 [Pseudomonas savastanoi pv. glycinea]|uniref:Uncharacterized protein n=1 Tax=Pseudomonas savastanoi pv. glycinea TaxID=318 RepID=A0A3M3VTM2_PSESG|nr:hypothetical protein ALQ41_200010 [Pseudomonas savastanoi pv. glycinea]
MSETEICHTFMCGVLKKMVVILICHFRAPFYFNSMLDPI